MKRYSARCSARYSARGCVAVGNARGRGQRKRVEVEGRGQRVEVFSSGCVQDQPHLSTARVRSIGLGGDAA